MINYKKFFNQFLLIKSIANIGLFTLIASCNYTTPSKTNSIHYTINNKRVFYNILTEGKNKTIEIVGADYSSFIIIDSNYSMDKNNVFLCSSKINGVDIESFVPIKFEYAKDKNCIFFGTKKKPEIDVHTFQVLERGFSKDKTHVYFNYYSGNKLKNVDPNSIRIFDFFLLKDKNGVYKIDSTNSVKKIPNADAYSFRGTIDGYYIDTSNIYDCNGDFISIRKDNTKQGFVSH